MGGYDYRADRTTEFILGSEAMKRFKYCTDEEMTKVVENYKTGGKTNLIYVLIEDNYVEVIEVFENDIHILYFETEEEMHDFFKNSGTPLIKDYIKGQQTELF